jgi:hypothetical protein
MPDIPFLNDPFSQDSALVHKAALDLHKRDSLKGVHFMDSLNNAKKLPWNDVLMEIKKFEEGKSAGTTASVFKGHLLTDPSPGPEPVVRNTNTDWMLGVIIVVLALLGAMRQLNNKRLMSYISAFLAARFAGQLQREEYAVSNRTSVALLICFVLTFSIFLFQLFDHFGVTFSVHPFLLFLYIAAGVTGLYLGKIIVIRTLAFIFRTENEAAEYVFYILLVNQVLGILLLPVVTSLAFARFIEPDWLIYTGLALIAILFIYRILRGILVGISRLRISGLYLFLYLCTLEFLPVPFAIKYLGLI